MGFHFYYLKLTRQSSGGFCLEKALVWAKKEIYFIWWSMTEFNPIAPGASDKQLLPGGSLRPQSYNQLFWPSFVNRGTNIDHF